MPNCLLTCGKMDPAAPWATVSSPTDRKKFINLYEVAVKLDLKVICAVDPYFAVVFCRVGTSNFVEPEHKR